jgi:hypothetical protein
MRILKATESISPAIARTKLILFTPFRMGRSWKLSATAYLATAAAFFFPFPLFALGFLYQVPTAAYKAIVVASVLLVTAIFLLIFYWCSRLQFAFFDIVLNRGDFVAPAWRKYGPQSWKWTAFKILFSIIAILVGAAPFSAYILRMVRVMSALSPGQPPPDEFIGAFVGLYFIFFFGLLAVMLVSSLMTDFVLPSLALENTTLSEAFRRFFQLARREPAELCVYVLLKAGLAIAGYIGQAVVAYIIILVLEIVVAIVLVIGYFILHALGAGDTLMIVLACVIVAPIFLFVMFYITLLLVGILLTFLQAYSLYFLGGRYPMLGDLLERSTPPPAPLPPPPPGYAYAATPNPPS